MCKPKRFIDLYIPITVCNLRCAYCYVAQQELFDVQPHPLVYTPEHIANSLNIERLGGVCCFNICGGGETMMPVYFNDIIREILKQGHYVMVVTNGTISKRFDEILETFPNEYLERLFFKFSFQYLELKRLNLTDTFFENVLKVKNSPCSFSLELAASDDFVEHIKDIKEISLKYAGALPHVTVLRDDRIEGRPILTKYPMKEYKKIWSQFNSDMFKLRLSLWGKKRKEFCYAGDWSACLNLETGELRQCNSGKTLQNVFCNQNEPIKFCAVGNNCAEEHCFISHAWLTFGDIPNLRCPEFIYMRNRKTSNGDEWVKPKFKEFLSHKLKETNKQYTREQKRTANKFSRLTANKANSFAETIFSVRNQYSNNIKRKVVTIMGITLKFKKPSKTSGGG